MILIIGATGMFGSRVVAESLRRGLPVRALAHSAAGAARLRERGVEAVVGDLDRPETLTAAFAGVETAFIVSPMDHLIEERETNALRAAQQAGARRVVKLYGAVRHHGRSLDRLHRASIAAIKASGLDWALVSPNSVMETSLLGQAHGIREASALFGCAGQGRVGLVAADDVAEAAAVVLAEPGAPGANYEITGPTALTMVEVAAAFSQVLGRPIAYRDLPAAQFRALLVERGGVPDDVVDVQVMEHFAAWQRGDADLVTDTYRQLTGRPPTRLSDWIAAYRQIFAPEADPPPH